MTERRADDATRDVVAFLKCEYLRDRVGEEFSGVVNAVTGFGLFVELEEIYVEGLVHVTALDNDYYHFDAAKQRLQGERTGASFHLGDTLQVRLVAVNLDDRKIDLELCKGGAKTRKGVSKKGPSGKPKKGKAAKVDASLKPKKKSKTKDKAKTKTKAKHKSKAKSKPKSKVKRSTQ